MQNAEMFLILTLSLIFLLLIFQTVTVRIENLSGLEITIEYFPLKLTLYNFFKTKIKKKKLIKRTRRLLFFLSSIMKAVAFLLRRTTTKIATLDFIEAKNNDPYQICLTDNIEAAIATYIVSFFYSFTKSTSIEPSRLKTNKSSIILFDLKFKTRFCNVIFAFLVFLFYLINKKGRNVNIVR